MKFIRSIAAFVIGALGFSLPQAHAASDYGKTKYPVVLVHGVAGAAQYVPGADYFWKMPGDLRDNGATVYVADLSAFNGVTNRGEALVTQIRTVLAATGAAKVNLIAHSQGGYDSRYAAAVIPQSIASVTTISTPHRGTPLADFLAATPSAVQDFIAGGASLAGKLLALISGDPKQQDPLAALRLMTSPGSADFNRQFPSAGLSENCSSDGASAEVRNGNTQRLYSWAGSSSFTNILDVADPLLVLGDGIIRVQGGGSNDGAVPVCSARFGQFLGTYGWNHLDEQNQLFGLRGLFSADPVVNLRTHANRLKMAGL